MSKILLVLAGAAICILWVSCAGIAKKKGDLASGQSYHERAKEALALAQGVYSTSRDVYRELRKNGDVDDEIHAKVIEADKKLKAAYLVAQDAVNSHDEATIKDALQTVCALSDTLINEISSVTNANADSIRNVKIALIVLRRIAMIV